MSLTNYPPQSKVPGHVHNVKEHALEKDLTRLSKRELLDLISRQSELMENKARLQKLPDKGQKIIDLYDRAVKALELKSEIDDAAKLLTHLNLGSKDVSNIEWQDKSKNNEPIDVLDSDDEDPLAILTSSNSVNQNRVIFKTSPDDGRKGSLVTEEDIKEAQEIVNSTLHFDPILENICQNEKMEPSHRFLPHKPKFDESPLSSLEGMEGKKLRDNSAASPPVLMHGAKLLSLRESIEVEHVQREKLKELQEKQAADRLAMKAREEILASRRQAAELASKTSDASLMGRYRLKSSFSEHSDDELNNDSLSDEVDE